jgi:ABC-type Fe3+/spermidine/putrescine transport system ATPase subunit
MPAPTSVGIRLRAVSAAFRSPEGDDVFAVRGIDLEVRPGKLLTLLGPSGCGKTTTLRMIAGFQEPSEGEIRIGERDVTHVPANRRDIGFVFQSYALFPHLTVYDNVAYGLRIRRRQTGEIQAALDEVLNLVGLEGLAKRFPNELSGGQQQRVALARAIVIRPRVLLFDEPLSNLDAKLRIEMRTEIQRLQRTLGITTVYVTHDQEEAMAISDRIAVMHKGGIVQIGTAEELYRRPATAFVASFLGRANILDGTVRDCEPGRIILDVKGCALPFACDRPYPAGTALCAIVRPEDISIGKDGPLPGEVVSRMYLGEKTEYVVFVAGLTFQIVRYGASDEVGFSPGERVGVTLPSTGVHVFEPGD